MMMGDLWLDQEVERKLIELLDAKYQMIYVVTHEEDRLQDMLCKASEELSVPLHVWSFTSGMVQIEGREPLANASVQEKEDPIGVIEVIRETPGEAIFFLKDFHVFTGGDSGFHTIRALRDFFFSHRSWEKSIVVSSPVLRLPTELEKHAEVLEIPLPGDEQISAYLVDINSAL